MTPSRPGTSASPRLSVQHPQADFHFWWFVTRRCNNHCPHCLRYDIGDVGEELDPAGAKRLLLEWIAWLRKNKKTSSLAWSLRSPGRTALTA